MENKAECERIRLVSRIKIIILVLFLTGAFLKFIVLISEERNFYKPDREITLTPQDAGLNYEDIYFNTKDGSTINGWFIPAKDAKVTILYCPGRGGNLSDKLRRISFFHDAGLNLFIFDYRGFGNSTGKPNERGLYKDAISAYDYLKSRKDIENSKIVVYGESLGAPVAANLCLQRKADALILQSSFPSLKTYVANIGGILPLSWLISEKFDTLSRVKQIKIPKLIVHGMDDDVIDFSDARLIYYRSAPPKQFIAYAGTHDDEIYTTSVEYKQKITDFLITYHIL